MSKNRLGLNTLEVGSYIDEKFVISNLSEQLAKFEYDLTIQHLKLVRIG